MTNALRRLFALLCVALTASASSSQALRSTTLGAKGSSPKSPSCAETASHAAICCSALVPVTVTSNNVKLNVAEPANQTVVTEIIQELVQSDSTIATTSNAGKQTIRGTFNIDATLCVPLDSTKATPPKTVQILTYGIGFDKSYWDIAPGYSYVDAAAAAGYATLAYNRLGSGKSDHPDPIQVVQCPIDVEILHGLTQILRQGAFGYPGFKHVIGTGHSYGSVVQLAQTAKYPSDVDAAVLTGFTSNVQNLPFTVVANNPAIAAQNNATAFGGLPNGYLVHDSMISFQLPFFRFPFFDKNVFNLQYFAKQTYTIGQQFTLPNIFSAAPAFTGPVDVVVGQHDFPFCLGDCNSPNNQAAATISALYPAAAAKSQSFIVPNSGHSINNHYEAPTAYSQINKFLKSNGF